MDRRQRKSREAIFKAFSELLSEKNVNNITVGEIIDRADVGRATFYAHFETKDYLLKELCEELFCHIFDKMEGNLNEHNHIFSCDAHDSVFLHLFRHLEKNDNNILKLLSCQNNEVFLRYFKECLLKLVKSQSFLFENKNTKQLPEDFWLDFISSAFVETVKWWMDNKMKHSPEEMADYYMIAINCKI